MCSHRVCWLWSHHTRTQREIIRIRNKEYKKKRLASMFVVSYVFVPRMCEKSTRGNALKIIYWHCDVRGLTVKRIFREIFSEIMCTMRTHTRSLTRVHSHEYPHLVQMHIIYTVQPFSSGTFYLTGLSRSLTNTVYSLWPYFQGIESNNCFKNDTL